MIETSADLMSEARQSAALRLAPGRGHALPARAVRLQKPAQSTAVSSEPSVEQIAQGAESRQAGRGQGMP